MTRATTQECRISRVFDAPRELVYQAFIDADQLAQWWGPEGCSLPRESIQSGWSRSPNYPGCWRV